MHILQLVGQTIDRSRDESVADAQLKFMPEGVGIFVTRLVLVIYIPIRTILTLAIGIELILACYIFSYLHHPSSSAIKNSGKGEGRGLKISSFRCIENTVFQ